MISETAPVVQAQDTNKTMSAIKDNAFVSFYNDCDVSEYLFKEPAFKHGFLPLEAEPEAQQPKQSQPQSQPIPFTARMRPSDHINTGTTPPTTVPEKKQMAQTPLKTATNNESTSEGGEKAYERERRPSFVEVSVPHHLHQEHPHHPQHRRHSSEAHLPLSWWPEPETVSEHVWVERDDRSEDLSADEEEDAIEEAFYASYD
ncbi:hypothetical protein LTR67_009583 [Exophiala xenobiotica]